MDRPNVKLGDKAKDSISGFEGIVVGKTEFLNGCLRYAIQPQKLHDNKPIEGVWLDAEQLVLVEAAAPLAAEPSGGPKPNPTRNADPTR